MAFVAHRSPTTTRSDTTRHRPLPYTPLFSCWPPQHREKFRRSSLRQAVALDEVATAQERSCGVVNHQHHR